MKRIAGIKKNFGTIQLNNKTPEPILATSFLSGAMIEGIVNRAKMLGIKQDKKNTSYLGIKLHDVEVAVDQAFEEMIVGQETITNYAQKRFETLQIMTQEKVTKTN